jgi:hypothetical protein
MLKFSGWPRCCRAEIRSTGAGRQREGRTLAQSERHRGLTVAFAANDRGQHRVGVLPASTSDKQLQEYDANVGFRCLRNRIRFSCFRNIKTFVDKIGRRRISVQQKGRWIPKFRTSLERTCRDFRLSGTRSTFSKVREWFPNGHFLAGSRRQQIHPKPRGQGLPGLRKPARSFPPWLHLSPA